MAKEEIFIDVQISEIVDKLVKTTNAINELKEANKKLKEETKASGDATGANTAKIVENEAAIKNLKQEQKAEETALRAVTKEVKDNAGAYDKLNLEYLAASKNAKDLAAAHGVNSKEAIAASNAAKAMSDKLKEIDKSVGQNQRSVGDYEIIARKLPGVFGEIQSKATSSFNQIKSSLEDGKKMLMDYITATQVANAAKQEAKIAAEAAAAAELMLRDAEAAGTVTAETTAAAEAARATATQAATAATEAGTVAMKIFKVALATTGIGLLVVALGALVTYFTSTNEGAKKFKEIMAVVGAVVQNGVKILGSFGKIVYDIFTGNFKDLKTDIDGFSDSLKNFGANTVKAAKDAKAVAQERFALNKQEREWAKERIKLEGEIGVLEKKASARSGLSAKERVAAAKQAEELSLKKFKTDFEFAKKNEDLVNREQALNSKKDKQAIADAQNRTAQLKANYDNEVQSIKNKRNVANNALIGSEKETSESLEQIRKDSLKNSEEINKQLQDILIKNTKEGAELAIAEEKLKTQRAIDELNKQTDLTEEGLKNRDELVKQLTIQSEKTIAEIKRIASEENIKAELEREQKRLAKLAEIESTRQQVLDNEFEQKKLDAFGKAEELAMIEYDAAFNESARLIAMDEETKKALFKSEEEYTAAVIAANERVKASELSVQELSRQRVEAQISATQEFSSAIGEVYSNIDDNSERSAKFQKQLAIFTASLNLAKAISAATASSAEGDPYTLALRIATSTAAVIAAISKATKAAEGSKEPKKPSYKFATGGVVPGLGSTDTVPAMLTPGEWVLNKNQQTNLIKSLSNTPLQSTFDYNALAAAMQNIKPQVSVTEINSVNSRVEVLDKLSKF